MPQAAAYVSDVAQIPHCGCGVGQQLQFLAWELPYATGVALKRKTKKQKTPTMVQNLWDAAKTVLRQKFIEIQAYRKKQEKSQINNLTLYLRQLKKEEQIKAKVSRRKEVIKIRVEINEIGLRKIVRKINETCSLKR